MSIILLYTPSTFVDPLLLTTSYFSYKRFSLVCRNICERLDSKGQVGKSNYLIGKKYCRKCEVYLYHDDVFCPCCRSQLRTTPHNKKEQTDS